MQVEKKQKLKDGAEFTPRKRKQKYPKQNAKKQVFGLL